MPGATSRRPPAQRPTRSAGRRTAGHAGRAGRAPVTLAALAGILLAASPASASSNWPVPLGAGITAEAAAGTAPGAPVTVSATCVGSSKPTVMLKWKAVEHATSYTVLESATASPTYTVVATVTPYHWRASFSTGTYRFEVVAYAGAHWSSAPSTPTAPRTIVSGRGCQ